MISAPEPALYWAILTLLGSLLVGSIARYIGLRDAEPAKRQQRLASLRTWWILAIVVSAGLLVGRLGICLLLGSASCIAWYEITRLVAVREQDRLAVSSGYLLIVINYLFILQGWLDWHGVFLPLAALFVLALTLLGKGEPAGYVRSAGGMLWGILFLGYGVSHAAVLMVLPASAAGPLGPAGWVLFLLILTEADDIFQAIIGRLFGSHKRHRITPVISPNKTWEGFFGGMLVIVTLAPLLAPFLTTLGQQAGPLSLAEPLRPIVAPVLVAVLISCAGFFGDINMSAIKRDAGVKDSSNLLPGMGGLIDRVDSLTMTAPVFVYFLIWWAG
jgi:phosphatidate cytidylyltransferase